MIRIGRLFNYESVLGGDGEVETVNLVVSADYDGDAELLRFHQEHDLPRDFVLTNDKWDVCLVLRKER